MDAPTLDPPPPDPDDPNLFPESNTEPTAELDPTDASAVPLCLHCLEPVDPLLHVCPNCGRAVGQFTPYLPYESIRWQADTLGDMYHQIAAPRISLPGRLFRAFCILFFAPILLVGLLFPRRQKNEPPPTA